MPTIIVDGNLRLVIHTRENLNEPAHVHVYVDNENRCRIRVVDHVFMDEPPSGLRRRIMGLYLEHADYLNREWTRIHGR